MRSFFLPILLISLALGCSSFQTTKNVWKGTKGLWATYVSPPASVDYEEKGDLPPEAMTLSKAMLGIDVELGKLERVMQNADRPPTMEWLNRLFETFPWINGFAGVKYDGTILGQQPPDSLKDLDFNYLLYEDKRQKSRALRADVQPSPMGPEIMLATPLYDGVDFLGIVVAYFDMRSLMSFSERPQDMVVLCPTALLWPGEYEFAATPLAGVDWSKVVRESAAGTCTNVNGSFFYMVRYLGNLPLVFAVPEKGDFPHGDGSIEQGFAFFPTQREKSAPPPVPEGREHRVQTEVAAFGREENPPEETAAPVEPPAPSQRADNEIEPGSRDSVLLKGQRASGRRQVQERQLEGENVPVERPQRRVVRRPAPLPVPEMEIEPEEPREAIRMPSPFGPRTAPPETREAASEDAEQPAAAVPDAPAAEAAPAPKAPAAVEEPIMQSPETAPEHTPEGETARDRPAEDSGVAPRATLPGGRPSPFGPRN